ncbi:MAG: carbohydrate porin [Planctomycetales bacterium]
MLRGISRFCRTGMLVGGLAFSGMNLFGDEPATEPVGYESVVVESMFGEVADPNAVPAPMEYYSAPSRWEQLMASPNLTGDWGGYRTDLMEHGIIYQGFLTQFYQGAAHGGREQDFQYGAKMDQFVILQGDKLGLWEGFFVNMHAETRMGQDANLDAVGLAPVNANMLWPGQTQTTAITNLTFTQALSEEWMVTLGKFNTLDLFNQLYPQNGRGIDGFMNVSTLIPLSIARPLNLSVNGAGIMKLNQGQVQGTLAVVDAQNSSTTVGVSDMFSKGAVVIGYWREFTEFRGLPGSHGLLAEISTRNYTSLDASDFYFDPNTGLVTSTKSNTWALAYFGEQKLWVDCCNPKRNLGLFTSWGISDGNPNAIRWSGNISVQGTGLNSSRPMDSMGVGYFYTGLSGTFENLVSPVVQLQDATGGELYYNMAVTQWLNVTPDLQIIQPSLTGNDTAIVVGLRGKLTF